MRQVLLASWRGKNPRRLTHGFRRACNGEFLTPCRHDARIAVSGVPNPEAGNPAITLKTAVEEGFKARKWPSHQGKGALWDISETSPGG